MKKLTDEELSLVLSEQAAGKLYHFRWRRGDCGCVASAVLDLEDSPANPPVEAQRISFAITNARWDRAAEANAWCRTGGYPVEPEAMLNLLARAGL